MLELSRSVLFGLSGQYDIRLFEQRLPAVPCQTIQENESIGAFATEKYLQSLSTAKCAG
jgi:hypothetical protein